MKNYRLSCDTSNRVSVVINFMIERLSLPYCRTIELNITAWWQKWRQLDYYPCHIFIEFYFLTFETKFIITKTLFTIKVLLLLFEIVATECEIQHFIWHCLSFSTEIQVLSWVKFLFCWVTNRFRFVLQRQGWQRWLERLLILHERTWGPHSTLYHHLSFKNQGLGITKAFKRSYLKYK